jgi:type VI secretion system protein VasD
VKRPANRTMCRIRLGGACATAAVLLSGCGAWRSVKEATVDATHAVFSSKVRQMNLVLESRAALNPIGQGQSLPVVLRIYQLKDATAFEKASYGKLLADDRAWLKADLLGRMEATLAPGATVTLSAPMADEEQYVGIAGFFRDQSKAEWQRVIPKAQWKKSDPVRLVVNGNQFEINAEH